MLKIRLEENEVLRVTTCKGENENFYQADNVVYNIEATGFNTFVLEVAVLDNDGFEQLILITTITEFKKCKLGENKPTDE